jgi:hypothetical protein
VLIIQEVVIQTVLFVNMNCFVMAMLLAVAEEYSLINAAVVNSA